METHSRTPSVLRFINLPVEIIQRIALETASAFHFDDPVGEGIISPPTTILSLAGTCRELHEWLSLPRNPVLYAQAFSRVLDFAATVRRMTALRIGADSCTEEEGTLLSRDRLQVWKPWITTLGIAMECRKRWMAMQRIKQAVEYPTQYIGIQLVV